MTQLCVTVYRHIFVAHSATDLWFLLPCRLGDETQVARQTVILVTWEGTTVNDCVTVLPVEGLSVSDLLYWLWKVTVSVTVTVLYIKGYNVSDSVTVLLQCQ